MKIGALVFLTAQSGNPGAIAREAEEHLVVSPGVGSIAAEWRSAHWRRPSGSAETPAARVDTRSVWATAFEIGRSSTPA